MTQQFGNLPASLDIPLRRGSSEALLLTLQLYDDCGNFIRNVDITGWSAKMQLRTEPEASGPPLDELSTSNGRIVLGGADGTITLNWSDEESVYTFDQCAYDLMLTDTAGNSQYLIGGTFYSVKSVTV